MRLVVGLGNPGSQYARTYHNVGFMVLDYRARVRNLRFRTAARRLALVAEDGPVHYLKPMTFMNLSGQAVAPYCRYLGISPSEVLVICDDLDLPPRTLRIRPGGGSGGHNGLKSLIHELGTDQFARLRVGIGRPADPQMGTVDFVLSRLPKADLARWEALWARADDALDVILQEGVEAAMNRFNGRMPDDG